MIKNLFGYPLILALTFYLSILNKREWFLFAFFAEIILFAVQIMALVYQKKNLKADIDLPRTILMEKEQAKAEISLNNFGLLPVRRICFCVRYQSLNGTKKREKELRVWGSADREDTQSYELLAGPFPSGCFLFQVSHARIYDYFGIFSFKIKLKKKRKIMVLPEFSHIQVPPLKREIPIEQEELDLGKRGEESAEFYDIREYQAGDVIKQIHWKKSVGREELLYKEKGSLKRVSAVLFLQLPKNKEGMLFHAQIKMAASFLFSLLEEGYFHFFVWENGEDSVLTRNLIQTREDIWETLTELLERVSEEDFGEKKTKKLQKKYRKQRNSLRGSTDFLEEMKYRYEMQFVGEECPEAFFLCCKDKKESLFLFHETQLMKKYEKGRWKTSDGMPNEGRKHKTKKQTQRKKNKESRNRDNKKSEQRQQGDREKRR